MVKHMDLIDVSGDSRQIGRGHGEQRRDQEQAKEAEHAAKAGAAVTPPDLLLFWEPKHL